LITLNLVPLLEKKKKKEREREEILMEKVFCQSGTGI